ncbi:MAG: NAD-dependent epimerase/dehydratase family protein [Oligoflexia bacterium]|nr:NAD-dependent epimerase/dehydratase family protein [Oligoflexia bacterium]
MKILVIGGNLYFGKRLVELLIKENHEVTLLNRQSKPDGFGDKVNRIKCDRLDKKAMEEALSNTDWDIVYDQVCYDYETAESACEIFEGKVKHYIHTSSQSVYEAGSDISEDTFNPSNHQFKEKVDWRKDYAEAKRQAECAFEKYAGFSTTYVRFPIVIGPDDYTKRFQFHIDKIKSGNEVFFKNLDAKISFISSEDAAKSLYHLGINKVTGPVNCCNSDSIAIKEFIQILSSKIGKEIKIAKESTDDNFSPYGIDQDWFMNNSKLQNSGLKLENVKVKVEELADHLT